MEKWFDMQLIGSAALGIGWKVVQALLILIVGRKVIKMLVNLTGKAMTRAGLDESVSRFLRMLFNAALWFFLIFLIAGQLGVNTASIVALVGSAALAVGLSLQGSLTNFAGSVLLLLTRPFRAGDFIICDQGEGIVQEIGLVYTEITTLDNKKVIIPNGTLANETITNVTAHDVRRLDITVGIGYGSDIGLAKLTMEKAYLDSGYVLADRPVTVFVDELADSAVMIGGAGWVKTGDYLAAKREVTELIKRAFDDAGIEIPFNQLDVHISRS